MALRRRCQDHGVNVIPGHQCLYRRLLGDAVLRSQRPGARTPRNRHEPRGLGIIMHGFGIGQRHVSRTNDSDADHRAKPPNPEATLYLICFNNVLTCRC